MIYTLTPNPSIDYIMGVTDYSDGAVNRTAYDKLMPGGKGINVSIVLNNLGIKSTALGFCGGFTGEKIKEMLNEKGIDTDFIELKNQNSRINVKIKSKKETEINAQGPEIDKTSVDILYEKLNLLEPDDFLVLAGSVPKGLSKTFYADILKFLSLHNINAVVDATGKLLTDTLKYRPFLIKPNIYELEEIINEKLTSKDKIISAAKQLQSAGAKNVLVSLGADGAVLICQNGECYFYDAVQGTVINTTGSGDSMVAGFISGYTQKKDFLYALKRGIAAGSASAFSDELATADEINKIFKEIK